MQNLQNLYEGQEIKILDTFTVTLPGKRNESRKFRKDKSYWVDEIKPTGVVVSYFSYDGRNKNGIVSETLKFDKNKKLQVEVID